MVKQDTLWKGALETFFVPFLHFFFSDYLQLIDFSKPFEFLDKELEEIAHEFSKQEHRYVDKLVKVGFNSGVFGWILIHIEIQGYDDPYFASTDVYLSQSYSQTIWRCSFYSYCGLYR